MANAITCAKCGRPLANPEFAGYCPECLQVIARDFESASTNWADPPFDPKERRFGDYMLGRQLGAGGMGVVYSAHQTSRKRAVALKLMRDAHFASPTQRYRFTVEAEAAARLHHPHIVRIHEVGEANGHPFFSMELIVGESLSAKIAKGEYKITEGESSISRRESIPGRIALLMAQTARAVHHAHIRGVLHRDLKPANVLIDNRGEPHLTDFGLAKILETTPDGAPRPALTSLGEFPGTPSYMSPEQVSGKREITPATDVYGLGAVLYELLTGWPPFEAPTPIETFKQITTQKPVKPRSLNSHADPDLETICLKCLEKDPRMRYGSAEALAEDLELWLHGEPIHARPPSVARRVQEWVLRNPVGTALIATLCLGLAVSLTLLAVVQAQQREISEDRNQNFDEAMQKLSQIWRDPDTAEVTLSARNLAILADVPPKEVAKAAAQYCFAVSASGDPSALGQRYALWLNRLQKEISRRLGSNIVFELKLLKRFNADDLSLAKGHADFVALSAVDYLKAEELNPGVTAIACDKLIRNGVIFVHTNKPPRDLARLAGYSVAFPDPDSSLSIWAKARLARRGLHRGDLRAVTNIINQGTESGQVVVSSTETIFRVIKRAENAGVTYRELFERYKHLGLTMLDEFPETPSVLAARQGLDRGLLQAVRGAVEAIEGDLDRVSYNSPGPMVLVEEPYFAPLREALRIARDFDGS